MTEQTTTEQLAEIERQAESTPATGYTPPEGWRVLRYGELLQPGDQWVNWEGTESRPDILHGDGATVSGGRYIRPIEPQPQPEPQPIQVREGRWRTRGGSIRNVTPTPQDHESFPAAYLWWDGFDTWRNDGRWWAAQETTSDLVEYLGPIEPDKTQELPAATIEELRSEVSYVQRLLGESRQRVTQLEELVASLRAINETQEKAFTAAGKENTALRNQLAAVASVAADRQRLLIELDAAQQVPADSPELRQLRADLAEVTQDRDTYRHAHELLLNDVNATHQRTKAMTVEAICEWIEPIRREDPHLRAVILFHLPKIMRSLAGLNSPEDVD